MRRERISCARPYQGVIGTPAAKGDDRRSERFRLTKNPFISVVDDDDSVREALGAFPGKTDCLILDVRMPGMSGVELQRRLVETYRDVPVIFITAHGDEERRARALKGGAVDYLLKPFSEESLMNAVRTALSEK